MYRDYFDWKNEREKVSDVFKAVAEKFGIETTQCCLHKDCFIIIPTDNDKVKFANVLKKTSEGEFKKNSEVSKMWCELVKDFQHMNKPHPWTYMSIVGRHSQRLFDHDGHVYCSVEGAHEISLPDFATEMKASEFYRIIEDIEENE